MPVKNNDVKSFREVMEEFEAVSAQFDTTDMDIEQALELHKKATSLLDELERRLKQAEAEVKKTQT